MTPPAGAPGTCGTAYRVQPEPIPRPRDGDDPREPGRRAGQERQR